MSDLPQEVQDALGKLLDNEPLSGDEEALLQQHESQLGIEASDE